MTSRTSRVVMAASAILFMAQMASAHPGPAGHIHGGGLDAGARHPFTGIDHILAMLAVGVLAAQIGGRAIWMLPLTFIGLMVGGGLLASGRVPVPMVEQGIMASVLVLGLLIVLATRLPIAWSIAVVGLFALFHGYAHVAEMTAGQSPLGYAIGFVSATLVLHLSGIAIGLGARRLTSPSFVRLGGAAIAGCGVLLFLGRI